MNENEEELINRLINGDKKAFNSIYDLYGAQLMRFCMSYLGSKEDIEEIVQDVFISLWQNRKNLRNRQSLKPFLVISTKNRLSKLIRKRINSPIYEEYIEHQHQQIIHDDKHTIEYEEFEKILLKFVDSLPSTQQKVLKMSKFGHMTNDEIATKLNLSLSTVKNALSNGLKTLRRNISSLPLIPFTLLTLFKLLF